MHISYVERPLHCRVVCIAIPLLMYLPFFVQGGRAGFYTGNELFWDFLQSYVQQVEIRQTIATIFQFSGADPVRPHCRFRVYSSPLLAPFSISLNVRQFCRWLPLSMYGIYPAHHYGCVTMLCYWFCQMWPNVNIPFPTQNPSIIARPRFELGYPADLRYALCLVEIKLQIV